MTFNLANIAVPDLSTTGVVVTIGHKEFGRGNFADVWKGTYTRPGRRAIVVAVKILRSALLSNRRLAEKTIRKLKREAKVWSTLDHPNVARFIGMYYHREVGGYATPRLVSVFYERRTLKDNLGNIQDSQRLKFLRQFLSGLAYLHHKKVIHGDLKPSNVLIDDSFSAVLTDFGLSRVLEASGFTTTSPQAPGTFRYMARELMDPSSHSTKAPLATKQSDIWSAGMTGLEILSGMIPYVNKREDSELIYEICNRRGKPSRHQYPRVTSGLWSMLEACWAEEGTRPAVSQLIDHLDTRYPQACG